MFFSYYHIGCLIFFIEMIYIDLESYYEMGADVLFRVEKIFYRYKIAMKNDISDVEVALRVVDDPYREVEWIIDEDERRGKQTFNEVTKHLKNWCGKRMIFAVTGSCFVNFKQDQLVRIGNNKYECCCQEGVKFPRAALYAAHNITRC